MTKILFTLLICLVCLFAACSQGTPKQTSISVKPAEAQVARTDDRHDAELQKQIEEIATAAQGRVGVAARLLETGKTVGVDVSGRFPMQSVYKLPIGMAGALFVEEAPCLTDWLQRICRPG